MTHLPPRLSAASLAMALRALALRRAKKVALASPLFIASELRRVADRLDPNGSASARVSTAVTIAAASPTVDAALDFVADAIGTDIDRSSVSHRVRDALDRAASVAMTPP